MFNPLHSILIKNLLKAFRVNLKACLGLVLPHQYCLIIVIEADVWVILFCGPRLLLCSPYYTVTIVLYDKPYSTFYTFVSYNFVNNDVTK